MTCNLRLVLKMAGFCLVCLNVEDNLLKITKPTSSNVDLIDKLKTCVPEINWKNNFEICLQCSMQLENAYKFRELCLKLKDARYAAWDDLEISKAKHENSQFSVLTKNVIEEKLFICFHCEKMFSNKTFIARHIEDEHKNFKDVNSINCNKKYTNKLLLEQHKDTCFVEPEQRKKVCDIKEKLFILNDLETPKIRGETNCIVSTENVIEGKILICAHCHESFSTKTFLARHIKAEHNKFKQVNKKYKNEILLKEFPDLCFVVPEQVNKECNSARTARDLKIENPELCIKLDAKFTSWNGSENPKTRVENSEHLVLTQNVTEKIKINCVYCGKYFSSATFLDEHVKAEHNEFKDFSCTNCNKQLTNEILLKEHQNCCFVVPGQRKIWCYSDKDLKTVENVSVSSPEKTQNKTDVNNKCDICGTSFKKKYILKRHTKNVHATEKNFKCDICPSSFVSPVYLNAHKKYHSGDRKHVCLFCGKRYITASDLYHHEKIHANKRAYICSECNKAFNTSSDLHKHKICVHMDRSLWKYSCGYCKKRFPLKTNLDTHIKTHTGEKNFSCHLCDKKCISRSALTRHIDSHTNIQSFKCTICDSGYKYQKSLHIHMFKNHGIGNVKLPERVKKYICHVCPRSYYANSKLQKHLRTHSGDKPFKCPNCEKCFIDKSYVKQHLKVVHNYIDN